MATVERIEPAYVPWTPSKSGFAVEDDAYIGRHRAPESGRFSMRRMFYTARHARR